ncbi:general vesicular transport factor p115-like [Pocillopora verrucosa]|uniref:general vesicular transport factor p115-like n=1 Tax=Pocillopora verrucosa TaxID=203993 RepID=UPI003341F0EC
MEYLSRGFKSVLGNQQGGSQPSPHETVERLCDRVASSTLLEDRRDAVRALKSLSKKFRLEVGTQSMDLLINVLQTDRNDTEITGLALQTFCNLLSADPAQDEGGRDASQTASDVELGVQFTEIFIKKSDNVTLLLGLLEEYEFQVRWPTVKLLTVLLTNKSYQLQQCILVSPMGVSRLMDLLSDSREIIRNEGLLLLIQLTKSNAAIQKIVAFENAFDRLLEIITEEGYSDGGIVVEDCLLLMQNLLKLNVSNQNFFREGSYVQRLTAFFELDQVSSPATPENQDSTWSTQKVSNIKLMLQLVRVLVSPDNPQQATATCQKIMNQCGLLRLLCGILMSTGIPADILTETINTVSEVIRGFPANQEYFSQVNAPSNPPSPAIVVLLMSMINDKQPFNLRCAVLYCFQCYLYKNEQGQNDIVTTLLPSSAAAASNISAGQLLCAGLFSPDPLSNWCAAVALSHCLKGNPTQKEQLLRVQLATSVGNPPVSLLQQCTNMLSQGGEIQTRVGLLLLLCSWLSNCSLAVSHFLHNSANIPYLMAQVEAHGEEADRLVGALCALLLGICLDNNDNSEATCQKDDLRNLIIKRIGSDNLLDKISFISKSEFFTAAVKSPEIKVESEKHVLFDHEFTKLFKKLEAAVTKAIEEEPSHQQLANHVNGKPSQGMENHDSIISSYKELIREQDEEIGKLKSRYGDMESSYNQAQAQIQQQSQEIQELREQLLVAQTFQPQSSGVTESFFTENVELTNLRNQVSDLQLSRDSLQEDVKTKDQKIGKLEKDLEVCQASLAVAHAAAELAAGSEAAEFPSVPLSLTSQQLEELEQLKRKVISQQEELDVLRNLNTELENEMEVMREEGIDTPTNSTDEVKAELERARTESHDKIRLLEEKLATTENEMSRMKEEKADLEKEHEDLLVMLTEQDNKIMKYKKLAKQAGQEVSEDDDDGDDDDDEEEEDDDNAENDDDVEKNDEDDEKNDDDENEDGSDNHDENETKQDTKQPNTDDTELDDEELT